MFFVVKSYPYSRYPAFSATKTVQKRALKWMESTKLKDQAGQQTDIMLIKQKSLKENKIKGVQCKKLIYNVEVI